jgi:hypothetical protein
MSVQGQGSSSDRQKPKYDLTPNKTVQQGQQIRQNREQLQSYQSQYYPQQQKLTNSIQNLQSQNLPTQDQPYYLSKNQRPITNKKVERIESKKSTISARIEPKFDLSQPNIQSSKPGTISSYKASSNTPNVTSPPRIQSTGGPVPSTISSPIKDNTYAEAIKCLDSLITLTKTPGPKDLPALNQAIADLENIVQTMQQKSVSKETADELSELPLTISVVKSVVNNLNESYYKFNQNEILFNNANKALELSTSKRVKLQTELSKKQDEFFSLGSRSVEEIKKDLSLIINSINDKTTEVSTLGIKRKQLLDGFITPLNEHLKKDTNKALTQTKNAITDNHIENKLRPERNKIDKIEGSLSKIKLEIERLINDRGEAEQEALNKNNGFFSSIFNFISKTPGDLQIELNNLSTQCANLLKERTKILTGLQETRNKLGGTEETHPSQTESSVDFIKELHKILLFAKPKQITQLPVIQFNLDDSASDSDEIRSSEKDLKNVNTPINKSLASKRKPIFLALDDLFNTKSIWKNSQTDPNLTTLTTNNNTYVWDFKKNQLVFPVLDKDLVIRLKDDNYVVMDELSDNIVLEDSTNVKPLISKKTNIDSSNQAPTFQEQIKESTVLLATIEQEFNDLRRQSKTYLVDNKLTILCNNYKELALKRALIYKQSHKKYDEPAWLSTLSENISKYELEKPIQQTASRETIIKTLGQLHNQSGWHLEESGLFSATIDNIYYLLDDKKMLLLSPSTDDGLLAEFNSTKQQYEFIPMLNSLSPKDIANAANQLHRAQAWTGTNKDYIEAKAYDVSNSDYITFKWYTSTDNHIEPPVCRGNPGEEYVMYDIHSHTFVNGFIT